MNKERLVRIYKNAKKVSNVNESSDAYGKLQNYKDIGATHIRICYDSLHCAYFDPPYLLFPVVLFSEFCGLCIRKLTESKYSTVFSTKFSGYCSYETIRKRDEFEYGDPIVVSEGPKDAELISTLYPYSFASLTTGPSETGLYVLSCFTDRIIHVPDNDDKKYKYVSRFQKMCKEFGLSYRFVEVSDRFEDPGEMLEKENFRSLVEYKSFNLNLKQEI